VFPQRPHTNSAPLSTDCSVKKAISSTLEGQSCEVKEPSVPSTEVKNVDPHLHSVIHLHDLGINNISRKLY
jgi:hypothetical protein